VLACRTVRTGDAEPLRALRLRALADTPDAFAATAGEEATLPASHWTELALQSELGDHLVIQVAGDGERWVGMAAGRWYDRARGIAHLWGMWVDPAARGRRAGERLVADVRAWAAGHGATFLRLGVITAEDDATPFYERLGFVRTGELGTLRRDPTRPVHYLARPV
jgi:ribosomal protein S18 acetylase RimI-like enzyme